MSGGVDSSVAAALLVERGHEVAGATLKLWGGPSDSGCCSVADVDDARRVAQQLGIAHHVFNMTEEFGAGVIEPYVEAHASGLTPNPCIECNRHIKFDRLFARARRLGYDALATGHHARVLPPGDGVASYRLCRGADPLKDQSYVLSMLGQGVLARITLPVGEMTKAEVRRHAVRLGLRTADKPDSQDVCFIQRSEGRQGFVGRRIELHAGTVVDARTGREVGTVEAVELVTVGQRRGLGHDLEGNRRYAVAVDVASRRVVVGTASDALVDTVDLVAGSMTWVADELAVGSGALAQVSAHGRPVTCQYTMTGDRPVVRFAERQRPVAAGQTIALYDAADPQSVLGAGIAG